MTHKEAYAELANAIVIQAVEDWRKLCKYSGKSTNAKSMFHGKAASFDELRKFFKSGWCWLLCGKVEPCQILARLERELKNKKKKN